ncbi:MAG: histidine--tRNA ligase [Actinomycetota bacterium]|nr:histidine--tRNA ligase [Actinomycetota bacterium]
MAEERSFTAPKGTYDLLPPESWRWVDGARRALDTFARAGYAPVETPMFEHTEVFERGVGATSEVVGKQMYTFLDKGGRSLTLRPEGTAPVVRAVLEHRLERGALPVKLAYASFMFRQERPQKGRFRQFFQVGIESIGSDAPAVDAEVVEVGVRYLRDMGVRCTLLLNSIGHPAESCRGGYVKLLADWLRDRSDDLAPVDRARVETNPLRTFDSKEAATIAVMAEAPLITHHLCDACAEHFAGVKSLLMAVGVPHKVDPRLVRGLDYYTRTAFEFVSGDLGSQNAVGGGGRYDGLAEALGGEPLPGIGFALGLDRILLAAEEPDEPRRAVRAYVVGARGVGKSMPFELATRLRRAGIGADFDVAGRSMKRQMKEADRSGAAWAVIVGPAELDAGKVTLRDLVSGGEEQVPLDELERRLA